MVENSRRPLLKKHSHTGSATSGLPRGICAVGTGPFTPPDPTTIVIDSTKYALRITKMARSNPRIICSHPDGASTVEVCAAESVYAVLYQGQPIKLRKNNPQLGYQGYKYGRSMFAEAGHAVRLARQLNRIYSTRDFAVAVMTVRRTINL